MLELKETKHNYHCESWETDQVHEFDSWEDFKSKMDYDPDYNLLFRFDLDKQENKKNNTKEFVLYLHHALQRHGRELWHAVIHNIKEDDLKEINIFLKEKYDYLNKLWKEFSMEKSKEIEEYEY